MRRREPRDADLRLNMTPMIDVVFQLIVFFLVSMKFRTLDMKIEARLPSVGPRRDAPPPPVPKVVATLRRGAGEPGSRMKHANQLLGRIGREPALRDETARTLERLRSIAAGARAQAASLGVDPDVVRGEVDAGPSVPSSDVVLAVDTFLAAGLADVTFVGLPPPVAATESVPRSR